MLDDAVVRAMSKWPNVPAVYGWLKLDRRGRWLIKDDTIGNALVREFISRNYLRDESGCYAFQNGPQRVFVQLDYTPFVVSVEEDGTARLHTGELLHKPTSAWLDEAGNLLVLGEQGIALVDDRDLDAASDRFVSASGGVLDTDDVARAIDKLLAGQSASLAVLLSGATLPLSLIRRDQVASRFDFVAAPTAPELA
jgi:hypothetical protein